MTTTDKLEHRLSKAKTALVLDHPFFASLALNLPFEWDPIIPTAATNGKRILFNPSFVASLTDQELLFLVAHECLHPALEHNFRRQNRDPHKWNVAADYVINKLLIDEGIGKMPSKGLHDISIYNQGGGTAEGIYAILPDNGQAQNGNTPGPLDDCEDGGTPAEQAQQAAEWRIRVAQAAQAAKMAGKLSANIERLVGELLRPKVDWREVLERFLIRCKDETRTFARFNRRFLPQGLYLPSVTGETMGPLVVAVDCSGSIDDSTISQFAAEIRRIQDDLHPEIIHIIYFDAEVAGIDSFERDNPVVVKPRGGGGTDYAPVFDAIEANGFSPVAIVFLTDLYCSSFGVEPDVPVMWVSTEKGSAPFGEVVVMEK